MPTFVRNCLLLLAALSAFAGCNPPQPAFEDPWDMPQSRRDSIRFVREHHYGPNFNFVVIADSLTLYARCPYGDVPDHFFRETVDSSAVRADDRLVVADFHYCTSDATDSVWVKVARDQQTMGWLRESLLLQGAVPDDPVSRFIHLFSNRHTVYFIRFLCFCIALMLYRILRRKGRQTVLLTNRDSFYPMLLCFSVSGAASLYAGIQRFAPETWQTFYYHPSLNPFGQPWILAAFLVAVWLLVLLALATAEDTHRRMGWEEGVPYLCGLAAFCMILYVFFTLTCYYYIGFAFLLAYWVYNLHRWNRKRNRYRCGACGEPLQRKGVCPHCGAVNR